MAAIIVPMPLTLPRMSTEEAEEIWLSTNGGALDSVKSNVSNLSDFAGVFSNDFDMNTPTTTNATNWWENPAFVNNEGDNEGDNNDKFVEDAKWLETADLGDDTEMITAQPAMDDTTTVKAVEETPVLAHPVNCDWDDVFPELDDVDASDDDDKQGEADIPIAKRSKNTTAPSVDEKNKKPPQMPVELLQAAPQVETRKSNRTRKTKATTNSVEKKKKASRRRRTKGESKTKTSKKSTTVDPTTTKRKREERLRRNRESANRSRIRKKKEMHELKQDVVVLRQKVVTLSTRIEELEENNQGLRERLAMYKKPSNSYKPAVTVFALVFTVAFFAQPSAVPQIGLPQLPGQGSRVLSGLSGIRKGSKTFLLAPFIDLFSNSALDAVLSTSVLPSVISIVTKVFIALALASVCALCFHYFGGLGWWAGQQNKKSRNHVSHTFVSRDLILESV